jgi:hypothetical protein
MESSWRDVSKPTISTVNCSRTYEIPALSQLPRHARRKEYIRCGSSVAKSERTVDVSPASYSGLIAKMDDMGTLKSSPRLHEKILISGRSD